MPLQQWLPLASDLLKSLVSSLVWPVTVIVAVWRLGPALVRWLAEKNVHLKGFGVTAIITAAREQQERSAAGDNPVARPALPTPPVAQAPVPAAAAPVGPARPALHALEQDIRQQLNQFPANAREGALVNALAGARLFGEHEYRYNRIFGSQILGLKSLDETGPKTVQQAREFFQRYAEQWPMIYGTYSFEGWLGFMLTSGLVQRNGDTLSATLIGHDFLIYLREARLTETKPG